ncbi:MAG: tyrosine-type recombinase/integrase [Verrucomicrobiae bacterium]|nr:tyrosine-type recombinase/integrase [Verrucomicrobiae bacterium]
MASLKAKPRSPYWYACITLLNGKRTERSTGIKRDGKAASRREAQKIADQFETEFQRHKTAGQVRKVLSEIYTELTEVELTSVGVEDFIKEWVESKDGVVAPATFAFYQSKLRKFTTWLGENRNRPIETITETDVLKFRKSLLGNESEATINHAIKTLRMAFHTARRRGLISDNPVEDIKPLKTQPSNRRPITVDELSKILAVADAEWRSLILFGFYTGQRLGDLALLQWTDIDLDAGEIRLFTRKTKRAMKCPISTRLREHLLSFDERIGAIHPRAYEIVTREGRTGTLSRQFYDLMTDANFVPARSRKKIPHRANNKRGLSPISFHSLRHTATSLLKNAGVSSSVVEELIGHDSSEINRIYTHIDQSALLEASERLPRIG